MFKALLTALAIAFTTGLFAQSKAATEAWVKNYVSNQAQTVAATLSSTKTNGVNTVSATENGTNIVVTVEEPTVQALVLDDCVHPLTASGITNGMLFTYTSGGIYRNGEHIIQASKTNLVLDATWASVESDGRTVLILTLSPSPVLTVLPKIKMAML